MQRSTGPALRPASNPPVPRTLEGGGHSRGARTLFARILLALALGALLLTALSPAAFAQGAPASPESGTGQPTTLKFVLALLPFLVVLAGIVFFKQGGAIMAFFGWLVAVALAVGYFKTPLAVALGGSLYGFVKSFGISIAVVFTMFMIFLMREVGALGVISNAVKRIVVGDEMQALNIGIGFGSFLTSLGIVTPAMFPPLLIAMGFSPAAAVGIAVLGYNATTSFALLSIPITLPAEIFGLDLLAFTFKICIFLPVIAIGLSFGILWLTGGRAAVRRGVVPAIVAGLSIAACALGLAVVNYATGREIIPVRIIGIVAGLFSMAVLMLWQRLFQKRLLAARAGGAEGGQERGRLHAESLWRALSPWIILTVLATIVSFPGINRFLSTLPGRAEVFSIFNQRLDLDILGQIYTWILVAVLLSCIFLRPTPAQWRASIRIWFKRFFSPFFAYAVYFSIAYVMAWSAMQLVPGESAARALVPSPAFQGWNMNVVVGASLAAFFGGAYSFVAPLLGLFGAVVGGSETGSNVLFFKIQQKAAADLGWTEAQFLTVYGAHAATGGVASAITPAKITNAVATIGAGRALEAQIMRQHLAVALLLTVVIGVMTGLFVAWAF